MNVCSWCPRHLSLMLRWTEVLGHWWFFPMNTLKMKSPIGSIKTGLISSSSLMTNGRTSAKRHFKIWVDSSTQLIPWYSYLQPIVKKLQMRLESHRRLWKPYTIIFALYRFIKYIKILSSDFHMEFIHLLITQKYFLST